MDVDGITRLPLSILLINVLEVVGSRVHGHVAVFPWCARWKSLINCHLTLNISLNSLERSSTCLSGDSIGPGEEVTGVGGGGRTRDTPVSVEWVCGGRGDGRVCWGGDTLAGGVKVGVGRGGVEAFGERRHLLVVWAVGISDVDWVVYH